MTAHSNLGAERASVDVDTGVSATGNDGFSNTAWILTSGYDGANSGPRRGMLYWPNTDTRLEANAYSRFEIRRRVHWLYANVGVARRLVDGYARLIGFHTPQPDTGDDEWDDMAFESFMMRAGSPLWFETSGKFDWCEGQLQMERTAAKDGFVLPVVTEGPSAGVQLAFYEAHQVISPPKAPKGWSDGAQVNAQNRHTAYGVRITTDDEVKIIQAADALYYGRFTNWGETHPMSILAGAVNNLIDITEIRSDIKTSIKRTAGIGIVQEQDAATISGQGTGGYGGPAVKATETLPDGTQQEVTWEMVMGSSTTAKLPPGVKAKVMHDDRPGPNSREFERDLIRDCASYLDLPFEALFEMSGNTGPGIRYWMADIRRWVSIRHLYRARWCQTYYAIFMAKEIAAGRLRQPNGKRPFWHATWIGLADPTIDNGRDGNLSITQLDCGLTTWADEWGEQGFFWKHKIRQRVREVVFAKRECLQATRDNAADKITVTYEEVFRTSKAPISAVLPAASDPPDKQTDD